MSYPAIKDPDHPGGGDGCSNSTMQGFRTDVTECISGGLWWKVKIEGEEIEIDFKPDRILVKHNNTTFEVKQDGIYVAGNTYIDGNLSVDGNVSVTGNVSVVQDIDCQNLDVRNDVDVGNDVRVEEDIYAERIFVNSPRGQLNIGSVLDGLMGP